MANGVEELLEMLFDMVDEAKNVPLTDKCMLERDKVLDLIDDMRAQFPVEFAEARKLIATRSDYLASAKREAELIRKQAEEQARAMVAENELIMQAKSRSADMVRNADEQARELKRVANEYCDDALRRTEEAVAEAHAEISRARSRFRAAAGAPAPHPSGSAFDVEMDR